MIDRFELKRQGIQRFGDFRVPNSVYHNTPNPYSNIVQSKLEVLMHLSIEVYNIVRHIVDDLRNALEIVR